MKRRISSEGGGAARDVEPEWCRLAGAVFLGAIVVTDGSKFEKKNAHKKKQETKGRSKNRWREKKWPSRVFKEAWNTSRFAAAKDPSLRRRHAT